MRALFAILFGYSVLVSVGFIVAIGDPRRHADRGIAWFLASTGWAGLLVDLVFLVAILGAFVSPWWLVVAIVAQDAAFTWRLWLAGRARFAIRDSRKE